MGVAEWQSGCKRELIENLMTLFFRLFTTLDECMYMHMNVLCISGKLYIKMILPVKGIFVSLACYSKDFKRNTCS